MRFLKRKEETVRGYLEQMERPQVIVHLRSGRSIQGVLTRVFPDVLVLEAALFLSASGPTQIDGDALIERINVDWIQRLGPGIPEEG